MRMKSGVFIELDLGMPDEDWKKVLWAGRFGIIQRMFIDPSNCILMFEAEDIENKEMFRGWKKLSLGDTQAILFGDANPLFQFSACLS